MKSNELRKKFLTYFQEHGHEIVPSSSLVPANDPTLLFTNAGMVQFKDVFLGRETRPYVRAASSQRCVRAGGKHNDLENVGYTGRHHTFFEMLGNFSFGDYFKREAIKYAWEFVTRVLNIPEDKLWVTVYEKDDEAAEIWLDEIGIPPERFARMGKKDNYWSMGDTGPCGPCTEIFYDHGPGVPGGPPGSPDEDGDRYVEVWNLVFMQYDRMADGTMTPLPKPSVDTGMGLERLAAVMQGVPSNYDIDLFVTLIEAAAKLAVVRDHDNASLRVIADHIRACAFLIVDGVLPSNEGRGYVLRRIIRRALRHGHKLGIREPFFYKLVKPLDHEMGQAYPELHKQRAYTEQVLHAEEERFAETLDHGMRLLDEHLAALQGKTIAGEVVFKLYDTYGFPDDLTADIAREHGLSIDTAGFEKAMEAQRKRARDSSKFIATAGVVDLKAFDPKMIAKSEEFTGYERTQGPAKVIAIVRACESVQALSEGEEGVVVLDRTPFYAESGGQIGDTGVLCGKSVEFVVVDTQKLDRKYGHIGMLKSGRLKVGDTVEAQVDANRRAAIVLNHSATHLLHAALRQILGEHVKQKGSLVAPDRLRFDFSHHGALTKEEIQAIEDLVNDEIRANVAAETGVMAYDDAIAAGALAFFGEKYDEQVRVLRLGDFSTELCGGTHVDRVGDIGFFKVVNETGIAAGVRRIEALTGQAALDWARANEATVQTLADLLKTGREEVAGKVRQLQTRMRELEKEVERLKSRLAGSQGDELLDQAVDVKGVKVLTAQLDGANAKTLRDTMDRLKDKLGSGVVVLAAVDGKKVRLVAGVTKDQTAVLRAGDIVGEVAQKVGGRGGGRADMAQAGGNDPSKLKEALELVPELVRARLS